MTRSLGLTEAVRWVWTAAAGAGVLVGIVNLREVIIDDRVVSQIRTRPVDLLRLQTHSDITNNALILTALAGDFAAGVFSLSGRTKDRRQDRVQSIGALVSLVISAASLIWLSFVKRSRRKRIFNAVRFRPPPKEAGS